MLRVYSMQEQWYLLFTVVTVWGVFPKKGVWS